MEVDPNKKMITQKANRIEVFIDAENVTNWIKNDGVTLLIEELKQLGQIIIRRVYGVWSRQQLRSVLQDTQLPSTIEIDPRKETKCSGSTWKLSEPI